MLACASACLALTGCAASPKPEAAARVQAPARALAEFAEYAEWLSRQPGVELAAEQRRLEATPASAEQGLRLALMYGQRGSPTYDPKLTARLLMQISANEPPDSVHGQLARMLLAAQPDPAACEEAERLSALSDALNTRLLEALQLHQAAEDQLQSARLQLEAERNERARLERQLKALKSIEAQIKDRDP